MTSLAYNQPDVALRLTPTFYTFILLTFLQLFNIIFFDNISSYKQIILFLLGNWIVIIAVVKPKEKKGLKSEMEIRQKNRGFLKIPESFADSGLGFGFHLLKFNVFFCIP